jgi:hypothetical protein
LRDALAGITPVPAAADWQAALARARALATGMADPRFVIISDGGLPEGLPGLPGEAVYIPVGHAGDNLAVATLAIEPHAGGLETFVAVANHGPSPGRAILSLYADEGLFDSRPIDVAPGESLSQTWTLPLETELVGARLEPVEGTADYLGLDDRAWAVAGGQGRRRVWMSGAGNLFLERFFAILPGYEIVRAGDEPAAATTDEGYDLYVFDGVPLPDPLPTGDVLIFNPRPADEAAGGSPAHQVGGTFTETAVVQLADHPLLADVDWSGVHVAEATAIDAPALAPLITSTGGPLLLAGEADGRRVVVLPFDLRQSDLPLQIAFPVLMANIVDWLNPGRVLAGDDTLPTGAIVTLVPEPRAESVVVTLPNGDRWERAADSAGAISFTDTGQPGIYTVAVRDAAGNERPVARLAINFFEPAESRIQPAGSLRLGQLDVAAAGAGESGRQELWPWFLLAALLVGLIEWWLTYRRGLGRSRKIDDRSRGTIRHAGQ